jgi:nucleoside 2-deoxyribosyltransferase
VAAYDDQPGAYLSEKVKTSITGSDCVLAVMTKNGSRSKWVHEEIGAAYALNKPVIPVVEKGVNVEGVLEGKQYIEFDKNYPNQAYERVHAYLSKIKEKLDNQQFVGVLFLIGLAILLLSQAGE